MSRDPDLPVASSASAPTGAVLVVADAFLTDDVGRVLLTQPTYRPDWVPPGGDLEAGETPESACAREVFEELGLVVTPVRLLVVDWLPPHRFRPTPAVYFLFDCGTVTGAVIRPCPTEVHDYAFVPPEAITPPLTTAATMRRLTAAVTARATGQIVRGHPDPAANHARPAPTATNDSNGSSASA